MAPEAHPIVSAFRTPQGPPECQARRLRLTPSSQPSGLRRVPGPVPVLQPSSVQFSPRSCLLCDPMYRSTPGFPVHHQLPELCSDSCPIESLCSGGSYSSEWVSDLPEVTQQSLHDHGGTKANNHLLLGPVRRLGFILVTKSVWWGDSPAASKQSLRKRGFWQEAHSRASPARSGNLVSTVVPSRCAPEWLCNLRDRLALPGPRLPHL